MHPDIVPAFGLYMFLVLALAAVVLLPLIKKIADRAWDRSLAPILCIDFDGVLHSYARGWKGPRVIPDPPVPGAIEWLLSLLSDPESVCAMAPRFKHFNVQIYSSRSRYIGGRRAMKKWLVKHGFPPAYLELIRFPTRKPPAFLQIDDRAMTFTGKFPTEKEMRAFRPWNKRAV
jgi:hypothetical protein